MCANPRAEKCDGRFRRHVAPGIEQEPSLYHGELGGNRADGTLFPHLREVTWIIDCSSAVRVATDTAEPEVAAGFRYNACGVSNAAAYHHRIRMEFADAERLPEPVGIFDFNILAYKMDEAIRFRELLCQGHKGLGRRASIRFVQHHCRVRRQCLLVPHKSPVRPASEQRTAFHAEPASLSGRIQKPLQHSLLGGLNLWFAGRV